jgi:hypothetical protein
MPQIQNPTTKGSRVLWKSLVGASTEILSLYAARAQHLIATCGSQPELPAMVAALAFGGRSNG